MIIQTQKYNGGLTSEQFLFYEIRITVKFYLDGKTVDETVSLIKQDNLFQYPTEITISKTTRVCYRRLDSLGNFRTDDQTIKREGIVTVPDGDSITTGVVVSIDRFSPGAYPQSLDETADIIGRVS